MGFMSQAIGTYICNFIGEFMEYDVNNNSGFWRSYMRINVRLDVRIPLKTEKKVKTLGGEWMTIIFKYERLEGFLLSLWSFGAC